MNVSVRTESVKFDFQYPNCNLGLQNHSIDCMAIDKSTMTSSVMVILVIKMTIEMSMTVFMMMALVFMVMMMVLMVMVMVFFAAATASRAPLLRH